MGSIRKEKGARDHRNHMLPPTPEQVFRAEIDSQRSGGKEIISVTIGYRSSITHAIKIQIYLAFNCEYVEW